MPNESITVVQQAVDREAAAIIGATDSGESRELISEARGDLLPYNVPFIVEADLIEVKAEKNYDSRGIRVKLAVVSSDSEAVKVNRSYTLWFFDRNPSLKEFVLAEMSAQRVQFAAVLAEYDGDPLALNGDGSPKFRAAPVLLDLHRQVEPLGIRMRFENRYLRTTRNGARLHKLYFSLV
jgi:hypothetical protein